MDELGGQQTPLHRLDARIKILTVGFFIVAVMSFPRYAVSALMPCFLFPLMLMAWGRIPAGYIFKKVLIASPFAVAVGLFNPWLDPVPQIEVGGYPVAGGWLSLASILIRFTLTVSAALTLLACTGIHRLSDGLRRLGVPRVFGVQLQLLYRYIFVLVEEGFRLVRGVAARGGGSGSGRIPIGVYGSMAGHLLVRSVDRAQRVYLAMVARGYAGATPVWKPTAGRGRDLLFLLGWVCFFVAVRWVNLAEWVGRWAIGRVP